MYPQSYPGKTRILNSLVFQFTPEFFSESPSYTIVAQDATEVQDIQNAPSISMGPFLTACSQMDILPTISIYARRGYDRKHMRLLYMNAAALHIWKAMGKHPKQIGTQHRPPHSAVLMFGMPFSE
jgi:hypothetical protein